MEGKRLIISVLAALYLLSGIALAARPPGAGNGGGSTGQEPPDLGDLIYLYRNDKGVPYLTPDGCWQPLPAADCPATCVTVDGVPAPPEGEPAVQVIPVDPGTCAIPPECAICTQEVDFGRINEARSPESVFAAQMSDVIVNLATADCLSLDPAGRIVTSNVADDLSVTSGAIDSPLQNMAMYRQLILTGTLQAPLPEGAGALDMAARAIGAASDKTGLVSIDLIAYLNQIMGLTDEGVSTILDPKTCINMKQEVMGQVQMVRKCFLDYGSYSYNRSANFYGLPAPPYIPADTPELGTFEYLYALGTDPPTFGIDQNSIFTVVFNGNDGADIDDIAGFARAADDARAVIDFMHSNPIPVGYETPVPCTAAPGGDTSYDLSISEESGLQVPRQIVDGSEGREFTVAIANSGPDLASGSVLVTALAANGGTIEGSPWTFEFTDVPAGGGASWTTLFSVSLGERTTIDWTATIIADYDVNAANNSVTASSNVRVTGGGGR